MRNDELRRARFILWENGGPEGWHPQPFRGLGDLVDTVEHDGMPPGFFVVTRGALGLATLRQEDDDIPRNTLGMIHTHVWAARLKLTELGIPERELDRLLDAERLIRGLIARPGQRWELTPRGRRELVR